MDIYFNFREKPRVRNFCSNIEAKRLEEDWRETWREEELGARVKPRNLL